MKRYHIERKRRNSTHRGHGKRTPIGDIHTCGTPASSVVWGGTAIKPTVPTDALCSSSSSSSSSGYEDICASVSNTSLLPHVSTTTSPTRSTCHQSCCICADRVRSARSGVRECPSAGTLPSMLTERDNSPGAYIRSISLALLCRPGHLWLYLRLLPDSLLCGQPEGCDTPLSELQQRFRSPQENLKQLQNMWMSCVTCHFAFIMGKSYSQFIP